MKCCYYCGSPLREYAKGHSMMDHADRDECIMALNIRIKNLEDKLNERWDREDD